MACADAGQCEHARFVLAAVGEHIKRQCFSDWRAISYGHRTLKKRKAERKQTELNTMWIANERTICALMPLVILATWQLCLLPGTDAKHLAIRLRDPQSEIESETVPLAHVHSHSHTDESGVRGAAAVHRRERRQLSDWLIAPNTRWCGRGNLANGTYNDLGGASKADKCCRKHDHCKMWIDGMSNRYDLFNYRPYTLSHCSCDLRFRTCLKMAGDEDANAIGKLFFNVVQTQCFGLKAETVCVQRGGSGKESDPCLKEEVRHKAFLRDNKRF